METIFALGVLLLLARALEEVAERLRLPPLLGNLAAGVILGASLLGLVSPGPDLRLFTNIGLFLLFFFIGLEEIDISTLLAVAHQRVLYAALLAFALPFALAFLFFWGLDFRAPVSVGLASVISIASLSVVAKVLSDIGRLRTPLGLQIFATVAVMELVGILLFSVALEAGGEGGGLSPVTALLLLSKISLFLVVAWVLANRAVPPLMRWTLAHMRSREITLGLLFGILLLFVFFGDQAGIHGALGGLLLGVALSGVANEFHLAVFGSLRGLAYGIFVPLFFAGAGLEFSMTFLELPLVAILGVLGLLILVRPLSTFAGARTFKLAGARAIAIGMLPKGSMELALLVSLLDLGLISREYFSLLTGGVLIVLVISTPVLSALMKRAVEPREEEVAEELIPAYARLAFRDTKAGDVIESPEPVIGREVSVSQFVDAHLVTGRRAYLAVDSQGRVVGSISVGDIRSLPKHRWEETPISKVMNRHLITVLPDEPLFSVLEKMALRDFPLVLVVSPEDRSRPVGIVTRSGVLQKLAGKAPLSPSEAN